jgi:hypothetical protein
LIWNVAGPDEELAKALVSAKSARSAGVAEVLADSRGDHGLRAWRSQALGSACADSDVAEQWLREDPKNVDALLLYARTCVSRALRAADAGDDRAAMLAEIARRACEAAVNADPADPTPLVAWLTLARIEWFRGRAQRPGPAGLEDVVGPWGLFEQVLAIDPVHREGHLRFLSCLFKRYGGSDAQMMTFARHVAYEMPFDADPQLLVLVALVEYYRSKSPAERTAEQADGQWRTEMALRYALDLHEFWFPAACKRRVAPIVDFSYLAHALWAGDRIFEAADVLRAMGPYAASAPWSLFGKPATVLARARAQCHLGPPTTGWGGGRGP